MNQTDLALNDGRAMPRLGMGVWQIPDNQVAAVVRQGIDTGFRLIDTAAIYRNERGVGDGVKGDAGVGGDGGGVWVTTKLWNDRQGDAAAALDESLALLGLDAVDLYLMHWPAPGQGQYVDAWRAMIGLREGGKARSIGVSNFLPEHLDAIAEATGVVPAVNQIELHPRFQQRALRAYHDAHGIVTQSWSPLGRGGVLDDAAIAGVAEKHGASAVQVVIAWHLARGLAVIPRASSAEHLAENFAARELRLDDDDLAAIDAMDREDGRSGPEPDSM